MEPYAGTVPGYSTELYSAASRHGLDGWVGAGSAPPETVTYQTGLR